MSDRNSINVTCRTSDEEIFEKLGFGDNMQSSPEGISVSCDEYSDCVDFPDNIPWLAHDETSRYIGVCDGEKVFWHECDGNGWPTISYDYSKVMKRHDAMEDMDEFLALDKKVRKMFGMND